MGHPVMQFNGVSGEKESVISQEFCLVPLYSSITSKCDHGTKEHFDLSSCAKSPTALFIFLWFNSRVKVGE